MLNLLDLDGPTFLMAYAALIGFCLATTLLVWRFLRGSPKAAGRHAAASEDDGEAPYVLALLTGGARRVQQAATAALIGRGVIEMRVNGRVERRDPLPADAHPIEAAVWQALDEGRLVPSRVQGIARDEIDALREDTEQRGLLLDARGRQLTFLVPIVSVLLLLGLGIAKSVVGTERGKPIEGLVAFMVAVVIGSIVLLVAGRPKRTRAGDEVLRRQRSKASAIRTTARRGEATADLEPNEIALAAALWGVPLLGMDFAGVNRAFPSPVSATSGSSSRDTSSGCGGDGGDGGGGCGGGGCGGCGGD